MLRTAAVNENSAETRQGDDENEEGDEEDENEKTGGGCGSEVATIYQLVTVSSDLQQHQQQYQHQRRRGAIWPLARFKYRNK